MSHWESFEYRTNEVLSKPISKAGTLVTNAWRRQQEQFIVKGNIALHSGGGIVFCIGQLLYDYLAERIKGHHLTDLRKHSWTLAILGIKDHIDDTGRVKIGIDKSRMLFTNYHSFLQVLTNQGNPNPEMFRGEFEYLK